MVKRTTPKRRTEVKFREKAHGVNKTLLFFTLAMLIFGAIMIFDASVYQADQPPFNDPFHFLKLHLIWILIGLVPSIIIIFWDYRKFSKLILPILGVNILMLIMVLFSQDTNGSSRWLRLGSDYIVIQPAEFIKPVFVIYLATLLAKEKKSFKNFKEAFTEGFMKRLAGFIAVLGLIMILIILEPDLGTTMIVGVTAFAVFLASGTDYAHLIGSAMLGGVFALLGAIAAILAPYRLSRVRTFIKLLLTGEIEDPQGAGYQMYQILIGIGSAGFWGKGFGQSRQRFGYLVEITAFTDSIFAVILEELGMLGGILFVIAWIIFANTGLKIARSAPDRQGRLIAIGITVWLTTQALFNMAANVGLIPLTGMPLPFITYGGSGTMVAMIGMAILLNISRFTDEGEQIYS